MQLMMIKLMLHIQPQCVYAIKECAYSSKSLCCIFVLRITINTIWQYDLASQGGLPRQGKAIEIFYYVCVKMHFQTCYIMKLACERWNGW